MVKHVFDTIPEKPCFPEEEEKILKRWSDIKAFDQCMEDSKDKAPYIFYDGPPFATGLPHYGHILAGTIKDIVCRYQHQNGYKVVRRWGWDCHGLPIEHEIDKKLGINGKTDVLKMGIDKYNEECRGIVQRFAGEWRKTVERFGRWIDMDNDYKTMDKSFMESSWWVFKQLFDKGQVYRAMRVMPYSTACQTVLSNFEVSQNYKEIDDPSIIVKFVRPDVPNSMFLAWTTTPWTIPSNIALCVNPKNTYVYVDLPANKEGVVEEIIVGKERLAWTLKEMGIKVECKPKKEVLGAELKGMPYIAPFDYCKGIVNDKAYHVLTDEYVGTEAGTMIVHQSPAHGEDDFRVCCEHGLITKGGDYLPIFVDGDGNYTKEVRDFAGRNAKLDADKDVKEMLKKMGKLASNKMEKHQYPHCWRSDKPLIYKVQPSWFIKVEEIREKLIANNKQTRWVPSFVQEKRFHNWLSTSTDWCVSRSRFWGTPIPLWVSDDFEEIVCIGSVAELEEYAGRKIDDIHRHFIDDIKIPSKQGKGMLKRIDDVFDCWFESGSMPYGQMHYPFENKDLMDNGGFPAQFIAEGLDQTRGWFYTLMVLSTHLFDKPPFKNLICNGLVLASDGKKMSKRLKNYPDPKEVVQRHGADAVRMYMCNSPAVRAEPLRFVEDGVRDVVKEIFLKWYNAYRFLVMESYRFEENHAPEGFSPDFSLLEKTTNVMDKWILASANTVLEFVQEEMDAYRLYTVVPKLAGFWEQLTNWYVRLNRNRMRGDSGVDEARMSLTVLYSVLLDITILFSPVTPFIADFIYLNLAKALPAGHPKKAESVHFVMRPKANDKMKNADIEKAVDSMQQMIETGRLLRAQNNVGVRMPVKEMKVISPQKENLKGVADLETYVKEELNVEKLTLTTVQQETDIKVNLVLGLKMKKKNCKVKVGSKEKEVLEWLATLSEKDLNEKYYANDQKMETPFGFLLDRNDLNITKELVSKSGAKTSKDLKHEYDANENLVILDFTFDPELNKKSLCRETVTTVQKLCKEAKLLPVDYVELVAYTNCKELHTALTEQKDYTQDRLRRPLTLLPLDAAKNEKGVLEFVAKRGGIMASSGVVEVGNNKGKLEAWVLPKAVKLVDSQLEKLLANKDEKELLEKTLGTFTYGEFLAQMQGKKTVEFTLQIPGGTNLKKVQLTEGTHFSL